MLSVAFPLQFLLAFVAGLANRHQQRVIDHLVEQNTILAARLAGRRIRFTDAERARLARTGKALGKKLLEKYAMIVTPETILRWHRQLIARKWTFAKKSVGRPCVMKVIEQLAVKMARENAGWGYERIQGALANVGHDVARSTIAAILPRNGIPPAPRRRMRWRTFIKAHFGTLAAADFFTTEVWTARGLVTFFTLFVIRLKSRQVEILGTTDRPNGEFMEQVARNVTDAESGALRGVTHLIIDNDSLFTDAFRRRLRASGTECVRTPVNMPICNSFAERWVKSVKCECLDRMICVGAGALRRALAEYVEHYHEERSHQGLKNRIPIPPANFGRVDGLLLRKDRLGGLLRYYFRDGEREPDVNRRLRLVPRPH